MPDKTHIHHKFLQLGFSHIRITFAIIILQATVCLANTALCHVLDSGVIILLDIAFGISVNMLLNKCIARAKKRKCKMKSVLLSK